MQPKNPSIVELEENIQYSTHTLNCKDTLKAYNGMHFII